MTIQINRDISIPIYTQIVGQIQFDIVSGRLASGTQLPSIRELAQELAVAPMTITQAYQELRQLGLIEMRHGSGTFVADFGVARVESVTPNRQLQLRRIVQRAIGEARQQGFAEDEIKQAFLSLLPAADGLLASRRFILLGLFASALHVYADDIERNLAADRDTVDAITFDGLAARPDLYQPQLDHADALLVPLHQIQTVRRLIRTKQLAWSGAVLGLSFVLRPAAREAIAALPPDASIGVVSRFPEFVNTMLQGIRAIHPLEREPVICLSEDRARLETLVQEVQAIVFATGAEPAVRELLIDMPSAASLPLIEYLHTPDATTYARIRQWLTVGGPVAPAVPSQTVAEMTA